ncbi:MAG: lysoplasmalogenase [Proteobacteria bacterium]|nr:lysoplasmalogenase [Pseudomonadota bacterium]
MKRITLLAFALSALAYLLTIPYSPYPGSLLVKALPVLILLGVALVSLQGRVRLFMAAALLTSAGGDIFLEMDMFTPGLASFLVAQLCYAWYFFSQRDREKLQLARLAVVLAIMLPVSIPVVSHAGDIFIPVAIYMSAICLMGIGAALYRQPSTLLYVGALLFVASDSMIGINRFVVPFPGSKYPIMITYYAAQLFILWGVMQSMKKPALPSS